MEKKCNQETGLGGQRTSEGSERYQIGPEWAWVTPLIIKVQFGIIQNLHMTHIPQTSFLVAFFFHFLQQDDSSINQWYKDCASKFRSKHSVYYEIYLNSLYLRTWLSSVA